MLQTYVDTVVIGALVLGGEDFVEQTILTTGFWSMDEWDDDRQQMFYPRSPADLYCSYAGNPKSDGGVCSKRLPGYRFDWETCVAYASERGLGDGGNVICNVLAVTDAKGNEVRREAWLGRVESFVDEKLSQADLTWFSQTEAPTNPTKGGGKDSGVYKGKKTNDLPMWTRTVKTKSLLSLRKGQNTNSTKWERLCDEKGTPVWRGEIAKDTTAKVCPEQGRCSRSWLAQRSWLDGVSRAVCLNA